MVEKQKWLKKAIEEQKKEVEDRKRYIKKTLPYFKPHVMNDSYRNKIKRAEKKLKAEEVELQRLQLKLKRGDELSRKKFQPLRKRILVNRRTELSKEINMHERSFTTDKIFSKTARGEYYIEKARKSLDNSKNYLNKLKSERSMIIEKLNNLQ